MTVKKPFDELITRHFAVTISILLVTLLFHGCAPEKETKVAVKPVESGVSTYKTVEVFRKDYLFDQPTANKKTEKVTELNIEVTYDRSITGIDAEKNTTAEITIKALKYFSTSADAVNIDFDSSRPADAKSAFARLIGQTYTIKVSPSGKVVQVSNLASARDAVKTGPDARMAKQFLSDESIKRRHEILALPDKDAKSLKVGDTWSRVASSPQGALIPKNYEKVYTVKEITNRDNGRLALIEMSSTPSTKPLGKAGAMEAFESFFDAEDDYTGRLLVDIDTGKVYDYSEKLRSQYTAAEFPDKDQTQQPDVLKLAFTKGYSIELID
jgi:hypothetical protein